MSKIYYGGFFSAKYGYTEAANGYRSIIESKYPEVEFIDLSVMEDIRKLGSVDLTNASVILHKRPSKDLPQPFYDNVHTAKYLAYYTVWECSSIPLIWVPQLQHAHEILAPAQYALQPFEDTMSLMSNMVKKYTVLPHILREFQASPAPYPEITKDKINILVISSQLTDRKGIDLAVRGFYSLPAKLRDQCRLIVKGTANTIRYISSICSVVNKPEIACIEDYLEDNELDRLVQSCDILLSPNRGEGYGIDIARCLYTDMPVCATDQGGYIDVVKPNQPNFFPIKSYMDYVVSLSTFHDLNTHGMMWPCPNNKSVTDALTNAIMYIGESGRPKHDTETTNAKIKEHNSAVATQVCDIIDNIGWYGK